jgi:hypothetical protein
MKPFFLLISLLIAGEVYTQPIYGKVFVEFDVRSNAILTKVRVSENIPKDTVLQKDVAQNIRTSSVSKEIEKGIYTVVVQFVTDKDGNISDVKPLTTLGYGLEAEVVRVVKKRTPWVPANQKGVVTIVREQLDIVITKEKRPDSVYVKVSVKYPVQGLKYPWLQPLEDQLNASIKPSSRLKKGPYLVSASVRIFKDGSFGEIRCLNRPKYNLWEEVSKVLYNFKKD